MLCLKNSFHDQALTTGITNDSAPWLDKSQMVNVVNCCQKQLTEDYAKDGDLLAVHGLTFVWFLPWAFVCLNYRKG